MRNPARARYKKGISLKVSGAGATSKTFEKFEGKACVTDFVSKDKNPQNKRKSPWRGAKPDKKNSFQA